MKIICNTARLNEACQNVQRAVSSKATMPIIEGILMKAAAGQVQLTGYDMDMGITTVQEARVEEEGAIVLNARLLCDILRRLPGETVSIEADARLQCTIRCGEVEYQLVGNDAKEYPELPTVSEEVPVIIDSETLEKMVKQTIFAVSTNDTKVVHTGIKFEVSENTLKLIAVDGFRLAIRTEAINYTGEPLSFVVPAKTLSEVIKLINEADPGDGVIKIKALEAFQAAADGRATKIIIPSELQGLAGLCASAKSVFDTVEPNQPKK